MSRVLPLVSCLLSLVLSASAFAESYVGVSGSLTLPQGGSQMRRIAGGGITAGAYITDSWAYEGRAGVEDDFVALGLGLLGHWSGWSLYDRFFGYSAFDPFVTVGAKGWIVSSRGQVGPSAGVGAFYHLDDHWSLRADADVTLGLDSDVESVFSVSCGVQYAF